MPMDATGRTIVREARSCGTDRREKLNTFKDISRRRFLGSSAMLAGASAMSGLLGASRAMAQTPLTVGFIYVGPRMTLAIIRPMPKALLRSRRCRV